MQEEFRGSPPGEVAPTFVAGGTAIAQAPIFVLGNSSKPPFGFTFPTFGPGTGPTPQSGGGLNAQGGIVGAGFAIGAINPLLKSPKVGRLVRDFGAEDWEAILRPASDITDPIPTISSGNGNSIGNVSYGVDINRFPGDLINQENTSPTPVIPSATRLNTSFGDDHATPTTTGTAITML